MNLELCTIIAVDPKNQTVHVQGNNSDRAPEMVPLLFPSSHPDHAGGMHHMPEVGAQCYCAQATDGSGWVVIGYVNKANYGSVADEQLGSVSDEQGSPQLGYAYNKAFLEPGDLRMSTGDGNHLTLRRGGMVELAATPLAQILMIPIENLIRVYAQRYQMRSPIGEIDWGHVALTVDGAIKEGAAESTPVLVKYNIKETAQDDVTQHYRVELRAGQLTEATLDKKTQHAHFFASEEVKNKEGPFVPVLPSGTGGVLSLTVYSEDTDSMTFAFQLNKEGNLFMYAEQNVHLEVNGWLYANASKGAALEASDIRLGHALTEADLGHVVLAEKLHAQLSAPLQIIWTGNMTFGGMAGPAVFQSAMTSPLLEAFVPVVSSPDVRASK